MTPADISVVIPALNEAKNVARCIESVINNGAKDIIIVDGGSEDSTIEAASKFGIQILTSPPGRATQQNCGAQAAAGEAILFLHADNWLGEGVLQQICDCLSNQPLAWGGAMRQRIDSPSWIYRWLERGNAARIRLLGIPFGDQCIFVRKDAFWEADGYPDEPIMEDLILAKRLRKRRWPVLIDGPVFINARRWKQRGVLRQTIRNVSMQVAFAAGVSPRNLRRFYPNNRSNA